MTSMIRPNRLEVSDRFPVLGLTIRTELMPAWFEVALATDTALLRADQKPNRTRSNFFSTYGQGALLIERGETVYLVPTEVLARFIGQEKLYFALVTFRDAARREAELSSVPTETSPWINLKMLTGRSLRAAAGGIGATRYASGGAGAEALAWSGDALQQPAPAMPASGAAPAVARRNGGAAVAAPPAPPAQVPVAAAAGLRYAVPYDDGFSQSLWQQLAAAEDAGTAAEESGIDEAIPDEPGVATSQGMAYAGTLEDADYPNARFVAAGEGNFHHPRRPRTINRIVIHITDGATINGTISWFRNTDQQLHGRQLNVSAHYVLGQGGEVVQMVHDADVAHHASGANADSIGIEHVANTHGLRPSEQQLCASAELVRWLANQYGLPLDRDHIMGHSEADPTTAHRACPNAVWDWDHYMALVQGGCAAGGGASAQSYAVGQAHAPRRANGRNGYASRSLGSDDILYDVPLVPQPNKLACWAASMTMLLGFRRQASMDPETLAQEVGRSLRTSYGWDMLEAVKDHYGFREISLPSNASLYVQPQQWRQWLADYGPLWVTVIGAPSHAIIVHGISGDMTYEGTRISVLNPWDISTRFSSDEIDFDPPNRGQAYTQSFADFADSFGSLGLDNYGDWRVLYLPPTASTQGYAGRPGATAQSRAASFGYQGLGDKMANNSGNGTVTYRERPRGAAHPMAVVEIASAIAGAAMSRILDNEGDVSWELDQLRGLKHVGDNAANGGAGAFRNATPLTAGWYSENAARDRISADFEIRWQYNGRSLGNIEIYNTGTNDAVGWGLNVRANIMDDAQIYDTVPASGTTFAGVRIHFYYRFTRSIGSDYLAEANFTLYGNGTHSYSSRELQS